jgi:surface antigen
VLAFASSGRMRLGHVAMVSEVISDREVLLTHANWSRRGGIEHNVRAVDVSEAGDWSLVKVWYGPQGDLGTTAYPTKGFIYSDRARDNDTVDSDDTQAPLPTMTMASADTDSDIRF